MAATVVSALISLHFLWPMLSLATVLATTQLFAQQSVPRNDENDYLERYAKQLALLQEARFSFSGYLTRSTPKLGIVARWDAGGTISVSSKRKSFHCTRASTLTSARGHKTPEYLGACEDLVTPDTLLTVNVLSDA